MQGNVLASSSHISVSVEALVPKVPFPRPPLPPTTDLEETTLRIFFKIKLVVVRHIVGLKL